MNQPTEDMILAALRKATEAGLFPRHSDARDHAANKEVMREVLQAALDARQTDTKEWLAKTMRHGNLTGR